ncbi:MAG: calcium/sodium antiporter [Lentisphaerales bacterium]|nr:MAG: calcium/sodium antiporter [Lentisphaerales bacterium]
MILQLFLTALGFVLPAKGAGVMVDGACSIAKRYKASDLTIGLTILALGTSAPEFFVSTISALKGSSEIALGNVLGSNIANLCLVLGVAGVIVPIGVRREMVRRDLPFCLIVAVVLLAIISLWNAEFVVSRWEAAALGLGLVVYLALMFSTAEPSLIGESAGDSRKPAVAVVLVLGGLVALILGGELVVRSCVEMASRLGVSDALIGVTIVAIGTSLPELAASVAAVLKGKPEMAIGNVVGSNILNTGLVLASAAAIKPLATDTSFVIDSLVAAAMSAFLLLFMFTGKKYNLDRWEAFIFLVAYVGYMGYVISRR